MTNLEVEEAAKKLAAQDGKVWQRLTGSERVEYGNKVRAADTSEPETLDQYLSRTALKDVRAWARNRRIDIDGVRFAIQFARICRENGTERRLQEVNLRSIHHAIAAMRISSRQLSREIARLSLCEIHPLESECDCRPPF